MSARDDYPYAGGHDAMCDEIDRLRTQNEGLAQIGLRLTETIDRMQQWKTEALQVLGEWERVWEAAGRPGPLGASKADSVRALFDVQPGDPALQEMRRAPDEVNEAET